MKDGCPLCYWLEDACAEHLYFIKRNKPNSNLSNCFVVTIPSGAGQQRNALHRARIVSGDSPPNSNLSKRTLTYPITLPEMFGSQGGFHWKPGSPRLPSTLSVFGKGDLSRQDSFPLRVRCHIVLGKGTGQGSL